MACPVNIFADNTATVVRGLYIRECWNDEEEKDTKEKRKKKSIERKYWKSQNFR